MRRVFEMLQVFLVTVFVISGIVLMLLGLSLLAYPVKYLHELRSCVLISVTTLLGSLLLSALMDHLCPLPRTALFVPVKEGVYCVILADGYAYLTNCGVQFIADSDGKEMQTQVCGTPFKGPVLADEADALNTVRDCTLVTLSDLVDHQHHITLVWKDGCLLSTVYGKPMTNCMGYYGSGSYRTEGVIYDAKGRRLYCGQLATTQETWRILGRLYCNYDGQKHHGIVVDGQMFATNDFTEDCVTTFTDIGNNRVQMNVRQPVTGDTWLFILNRNQLTIDQDGEAQCVIEGRVYSGKWITFTK